MSRQTQLRTEAMRLSLYLLAPLAYIYIYHIPAVKDGLQQRYGTKDRWIIDPEKDRVLQEHIRSSNDEYHAQRDRQTTSQTPNPTVNIVADSALPMEYERS